jgi:cytochrome c6
MIMPRQFFRPWRRSRRYRSYLSEFCLPEPYLPGSYLSLGIRSGVVKLVVMVWVVILGVLLLSLPAMADDGAAQLNQGKAVFAAQCAGCHSGGGNIVRRGKNLQLKTLQRNQVDTLEAIQQLVGNGKGNMSAYADRLSSEEIAAVAVYVLDQAQQHWPS